MARGDDRAVDLLEDAVHKADAAGAMHLREAVNALATHRRILTCRCREMSTSIDAVRTQLLLLPDEAVSSSTTGATLLLGTNWVAPTVVSPRAHSEAGDTIESISGAIMQTSKDQRRFEVYLATWKESMRACENRLKRADRLEKHIERDKAKAAARQRALEAARAARQADLDREQEQRRNDAEAARQADAQEVAKRRMQKQRGLSWRALQHQVCLTLVIVVVVSVVVFAEDVWDTLLGRTCPATVQSRSWGTYLKNPLALSHRFTSKLTAGACLATQWIAVFAVVSAAALLRVLVSSRLSTVFLGGLGLWLAWRKLVVVVEGLGSLRLFCAASLFAAVHLTGYSLMRRFGDDDGVCPLPVLDRAQWLQLLWLASNCSLTCTVLFMVFG